jgi:molecular chaperone GrpE
MKTENIKEEEAENAENVAAEQITENETQEAQESANDEPETDDLTKLQDELAESRDKYIRLYSEFDNFRRRTSKEKLDMILTANEDLMVALIPILDDFERAGKSFEDKDVDIKAIKDGLHLIQDKFLKILEQKGLVAMDGKVGMAFNPDFHEAITQIPAPKKSLKGKVVDVIEKGYLLKEKVVRFAKVVIGN